MRKQAERFGAELLSDDVIEVDLTATPKVVKTDSDTYLAKAVIIATGSKYKELGVPGEKQLAGHGVSWCATCDGFFFREHDIAVIGGGDSAMEEATFLTRFGKSVTVIHRRDTLRASKIMQDRALANPKIKFLWDSEVVSRSATGKLTGLRVRNIHDRRGARAAGDRRVRRDRPRPAQRAVRRAARHRPRGIPAGRGSRPPAPRSRASSPAATSSTTPTGRPSPRRARAAAAAIDAERWLAASTTE